MFVLRWLRERLRSGSALKSAAKSTKAPPAGPRAAREAGAIQGPVAGRPHRSAAPDAIPTLTNNGNPKDALASLKDEEIIFILPSKEGKEERPNHGRYLIYTLSEDGEPTSTDGNAFRLSERPAQLPEDSPLLARFLLVDGTLPPWNPLRSGASAEINTARSQIETHVIVSTRSGLRQAEAFYQGVLRPLLCGALGLAEVAGESAAGGADGYYRVTVTRDENSIRDFARGLVAARRGGEDEGPRGKEQMVILLSGDGGVVDLLNGLDRAGGDNSAQTPPPPPTIALLPLGTANALFHSLHKPHYSGASSSSSPSAPAPSPLVLGLRTLFRGRPAPLPVFRASFSPGARLVPSSSAPPSPPSSPEPPVATTTTTSSSSSDGPVGAHVDRLLGAIVASYGFHASLVWESDTPAYRAHGDKRFGMAAAELLRAAHAYAARVEVRQAQPPPGSRSGRRDGWVALHGGSSSSSSSSSTGEPRFNYVLATMVSNLERTFTISPASRPLDGRLRLVHFGDVGGERTMEIMMAAYREGSHVGMEGVGYEEVEEVKVTVEEDDARWRKVCIDGTIVEIEKGGSMSVARERRELLRVLVDGITTPGV